MIRKRRRLALTAGLAIVMLGLPACQSAQGLHWGWNRTDGGDSQYVTRKPVYQSLRGRTVHPGGYAGIDYSAGSPRRVRVPAPAPGAVDAPIPTVTVDQGGWGAH
jgi:hypothetical protein